MWVLPRFPLSWIYLSEDNYGHKPGKGMAGAGWGGGPAVHLLLRLGHHFPVCVAVSSVTSHFPLTLAHEAYFCFSPPRCQQLAAHLWIPATQRDTWLSQTRHRCHGAVLRARAHTDENSGMGQQQGNAPHDSHTSGHSRQDGN